MGVFNCLFVCLFSFVSSNSKQKINKQTSILRNHLAIFFCMKGFYVPYDECGVYEGYQGKLLLNSSASVAFSTQTEKHKIKHLWSWTGGV